MYVQRPMSSISAPVQAVLDLFERDLSEVRFGDLDAKRLAALADEVRAAADLLAAHEARTSELRSALGERQDALLQQAQRALAFARIHAEDDAALSARIAAISLPKAPKRAKAEPPRAAEPSAEPEVARSRGASAQLAEDGARAEVAAGVGRRGKRREATRVVTRDDEAFEAPQEA